MVYFVAILKLAEIKKQIVDYCEVCGIMLVNKNDILCFCLVNQQNKVHYPSDEQSTVQNDIKE